MTTTTLLLILFLLLFPFFLLPITTINITSTSIKLEELPKKLHESPKFYVPEKISLREVFLNRKIIVRCATPTRALVYRVIADHLCSPLLEPFYTAQAKIGEAIFADEATACLNFSLASLTERMLQRGQWNGRGDCRVSKADCCSDLAYLQCHQMLGGVLCSVDPLNSDYYATALIESPEVVFGLKVAYFIFSDFITSVTYEYAMSVKCSHYGTLEECTHFLSLAIMLVLVALLLLSPCFCCFVCCLKAYRKKKRMAKMSSADPFTNVKLC